MSYCNGTCEHLDEKKHKCNKTGERLSYIKGWWGITHEHVGNLECDEEDSKQNSEV